MPSDEYNKPTTELDFLNAEQSREGLVNQLKDSIDELSNLDPDSLDELDLFCKKQLEKRIQN